MYIFIWSLMALTASYLVARLLTSIAIFPGQIFANVQNIHNFKPEQAGLKLTFAEEKTKDNRVYPTVKITPIESSGIVVIVFNGQNATFRNKKKLNTYCQLAKDTNNTVIGFDYSGTGLKRITTWSSKALIDDGFHLALQVIKTMGKNTVLILKGNSLGGAISTKVAKRCHDLGIKAYLWDGRSFKSASSLVAGQIQTLHKSGHYENALTKKLSTITQPMISIWLSLTQFEIDVSEDYKRIPSEYKNYYVVRSKKHAAVPRAQKKDDVMIPHCATLESDSVIKDEVKKIIDMGNKDEPRDIAYYRNRRKVTSKLRENAHSMPETELFCRNDVEVTAYDLFRFFSNIYVENHRLDEMKTNSLKLSI
ncbi:MAG: hypothetical protein H0U57_11760 [Tatlockia sp.]|nr:hypothetical protein [Tatlockia sp.]